jgi:hypothetical protein
MIFIIFKLSHHHIATFKNLIKFIDSDLDFKVVLIDVIEDFFYTIQHF